VKYAAYGLVFFLALILQTFGPPGLSLFGFRPELILLAALLYAMLEGPTSGGLFGFAGGLLQDLLIGRFLGLGAVTVMATAFGVGFLSRRLYKENLVVRFSTVLVATWAGQILYLLGQAAFGAAVVWDYFTWRTILATGILNGLLGLIVYGPLARLNKRIVYWDELLKRTG